MAGDYSGRTSNQTTFDRFLLGETFNSATGDADENGIDVIIILRFHDNADVLFSYYGDDLNTK